MRVPRVVWLITALNLALLLLFATLLPTWRAPDEPQHVDLVQCEQLRVVRSLTSQERRDRIGTWFPEWA